jgi:hypothetical protein
MIETFPTFSPTASRVSLWMDKALLAQDWNNLCPCVPKIDAATQEDGSDNPVIMENCNTSERTFLRLCTIDFPCSLLYFLVVTWPRTSRLSEPSFITSGQNTSNLIVHFLPTLSYSGMRAR